MIKILIIGGLLYLGYRLFLPNSLRSGENDNEYLDEDYTDYEEIE
jgi:hypothetical protein